MSLIFRSACRVKPGIEGAGKPPISSGQVLNRRRLVRDVLDSEATNYRGTGVSGRLQTIIDVIVSEGCR
jgi:hypothetical protein